MSIPIFFGLGTSFDFDASNIKRAPRWMPTTDWNGFSESYKIRSGWQKDT